MLRVAAPPPTGAYSARFITRGRALFWPFSRLWFRPSLEGVETLPEGAFLVVANHSGYGVMEILTLLCLWVGTFGLRRPVVGLAHDLGMVRPFRWVVCPIGGLRATRDNAVRALRAGHPVLVFPGGDVDALRPFSQRSRVVWNGRSGFIDAARQAQVPVVPLAICGSHAQYTLLPGGPVLARLLGLRRLRLATWPIPLGGVVALVALGAAAFGRLRWAWAGAAVLGALFPNPTRIQYRLLAPEAPPDPSASETDLAARAEAIRQRIEREVEDLARTRHTPWG